MTAETMENDLMKLTELRFSRILEWLKGKQAAPEVRLRISNLTRQTVLASSAELADKGEKRRKGLLGRERLSPGEGLWILPCEAVHTFGMQFPIDLIYLDRNHRIKKIRSNVPPWRLSACLTAHSVLELASGTIRDTLTRTGDTLEFSSAPLTDEGSYAFASHAQGVPE
jgi:uncharacterized membrane protein (UPF0127 family)